MAKISAPKKPMTTPVSKICEWGPWAFMSQSARGLTHIIRHSHQLPAPSGVIVPNFTQRGYLVSWKCSTAWLFPPDPENNNRLIDNDPVILLTI